MRISDWSSDVCSSDLFYERASGAQMHAAYFRPGGVHQDLPVKLLADIGDWCDRSQKLLDDSMSLVLDNRIYKQRCVDIAGVSQEDARSEERRAGKECVSRSRSGWTPYS